jgi:NADPH-dependent 2,4-dienoyl-CoA reductase/sulfur reductase-like enzyme
MSKKVIVIGGDAAGMSAASQIKRQQKDWHVTVFEKGNYVSYAACGMPYYLEGTVAHFNSLVEITPETFINDRKIDLRLNHEVIRVNCKEKKVTVKNKENTFEDSFDFLVIATGASPVKPDFSVTSDKVFTLNNLPDTEKLNDFIKQTSARSCAVIGGGFIAVEMIEAFKMRGLDTHLIHRRSSLARMFEPEISEIILKKAEKNGVVLHLDSHIKEIRDFKGQTEVVLENKTLKFDFILLATGVMPNTDFLLNSGIKLGVKNSVSVNEFMQTSFPFIYSAGDCTETKNIVSQEKIFLPLALKANREGMIAGLNISGKKEKFPGCCETAVTKIFDKGIARTGLTLERALKNGFDAVKFSVISGTKARYYPDSGKIKSVIVAEKGSGKVLGAQLAGPVEAVKRIDVWATVITSKMTLNNVYNLDLAYSPPFSPVWDPVLLAARVGRKHI